MIDLELSISYTEWSGVIINLYSSLTPSGQESLFDDKAVEIEELTYIIKQVSDISVVILHMSHFLLISLYWLLIVVACICVYQNLSANY